MIVIKVGIIVLNWFYSLLKLLPVQNKITYISRQMNTIPQDFQLIIDNFSKKDKSFKHIVLAKRIPSHMVGKLLYCFHIFIQMYHIATSKAVLLDTYCIPVSILKQRENLIVIQLWHALGAFKKFGYSILDQKEGSSSKIAKTMKMHYNYTYVLSSSEYASHFFAEAFHVDESKVLIYPLPKTDLLLNSELKESIIKKIYNRYPILNNGKRTIVYAPTFRKDTEDNLKDGIMKLINKIDFNNYNFVLKKHPLTEFVINDDRIIEEHDFSSLEFFHVADCIITDYSASLFEASLLNKPIYFYAFDYEEYMQGRNFYFDYKTMVPGKICYNADELVNELENVEFNYDRLREFNELMIKKPKLSYTDDFVDFLIQKLKEE